MRLRNDSGVPLHIPTDPAVTVAPGDTVDRDVYAAGLTVLDHEFVDGEWRKTAARKTTAKTAEEASK